MAFGELKSMKPRASLACLLLLGGLFAPVNAPAADGRGCTRNHLQGQKTCPFKLVGPPLTIYAESDGTMSALRVWVTLRGSPEAVILECSVPARPGYKSCTKSLPNDTIGFEIPQHPAAPPVSFDCHFQGNGTAWYFSCNTGPDEALGSA